MRFGGQQHGCVQLPDCPSQSFKMTESNAYQLHGPFNKLQIPQVPCWSSLTRKTPSASSHPTWTFKPAPFPELTRPEHCYILTSLPGQRGAAWRCARPSTSIAQPRRNFGTSANGCYKRPSSFEVGLPALPVLAGTLHLGGRINSPSSLSKPLLGELGPCVQIIQTPAVMKTITFYVIVLWY